MRGFQIAQGSTVGVDHRKIGKNCQDAAYVVNSDEVLVALVADGCGSGAHSEVGAKIGARIAANRIFREATQNPVVNFEKVRAGLIGDLEEILVLLEGSRSQTVNDYLLFTLVGVVITSDQAVFFSIGDGYLSVNGEKILLGPFEKNAPPYPAYGLVPTALEPAQLLFQIQRTLPTAELEHFVIGTDGVEEMEKAIGKPFPNKPADLVGPIGQFWKEDRFYANPDIIRRQLFLMNGGVNAAGPIGHLKDDITLVVGRREKKVEAVTNG